MVDATILLVTLRVVGCAVAVPGLVTWAIILHSRRQGGAAVVSISVAVLLASLMLASGDREQFNVETHGYTGAASSFLVVIIATAILVSLGMEANKHWDSTGRRESKDCDGNEARDSRKLVR